MKAGFYKVVLGGEPSIAQYDGIFDVWHVIGSDEGLLAVDFDKIGRCFMLDDGSTPYKRSREANRKAAAKYREANRDNIRAYEKQYREANKDKLRAYRRDYMQRYRNKSEKVLVL